MEDQSLLEFETFTVGGDVRMSAAGLGPDAALGALQPFRRDPARLSNGVLRASKSGVIKTARRATQAVTLLRHAG